MWSVREHRRGADQHGERAQFDRALEGWRSNRRRPNNPRAGSAGAKKRAGNFLSSAPQSCWEKVFKPRWRGMIADGSKRCPVGKKEQFELKVDSVLFFFLSFCLFCARLCERSLYLSFRRLTTTDYFRGACRCSGAARTHRPGEAQRSQKLVRWCRLS